MPQDVYDTPLVSMLEPFVSYSSNKQIEGFDYKNPKIADMASTAKKQETQWNKAVDEYYSMEKKVQDLSPKVSQNIQTMKENDSNKAGPGMNIQNINDKGKKLRMQDDAIKMIEGSNSIIILSIVFILAVCIFLGLAFNS
jgi:hypothetical protein